MSDFQAGPDNFNNDSNNNDSGSTKRPGTLLDILMGIGISAIAYAIIWFASVRIHPMIITPLIDFIVLAAFGFLTVKFFRTSHVAAAIIMLVLISPAIFALLLLGACSIMFSPR